MKVSLIGTGMDGERSLTREAAQAICDAQLLIGASRMLAPYEQSGKQLADAWEYLEICDLLHDAQCGGCMQAAILLSGDSGFYSGAKNLLPYLADYDVQVLPGISSLSYFCAKTGFSYEEMYIVSLHGRTNNIASHVKHHRLTFFLLGGKVNAAMLCQRLCGYGMADVTVHVGENLGTEKETVTAGAAKDLTMLWTGNLTVAIVENPEALSFLPTGIPDEAFERVTAVGAAQGAKTIPMTKSEVRAVSVGKLQVQEDNICWDVGCGTGSVSVELALRAPAGFVYAFDRNEQAAALTMRNAMKFGCDNLSAICAEFPPEDAESLAEPDCVFIGGSGGKCDKIIRLACAMNPAVRIVVTAVSLETLAQAHAALTEAFGVCSVTQLCVSRTEAVGRVSMLRAANPVFILQGIPE